MEENGKERGGGKREAKRLARTKGLRNRKELENREREREGWRKKEERGQERTGAGKSKEVAEKDGRWYKEGKRKYGKRNGQGMDSQERKGGRKMRKERIKVGEREAAVADITGGY